MPDDTIVWQILDPMPNSMGVVKRPLYQLEPNFCPSLLTFSNILARNFYNFFEKKSEKIETFLKVSDFIPGYQEWVVPGITKYRLKGMNFTQPPNIKLA